MSKKIDLTALTGKQSASSGPKLDRQFRLTGGERQSYPGVALDKRQFDVDQDTQFVVVASRSNAEYAKDGKGPLKTILKVWRLDDVEAANKGERVLDQSVSLSLEIMGDDVSHAYETGQVIALPNEEDWYITFSSEKTAQGWKASGFKIVTSQTNLKV